MKDCNTTEGGERINSKVIRSGCYSFRVLSHPDSSSISGEDLSCPNKIISQVSWLTWTSRIGRAEDGWEPGSAPVQRPVPDIVPPTAWMQWWRGQVSVWRVAKVLLQWFWHHTSVGNTTQLEQFSLILKKRYMQLAIAIQWIFLTQIHLGRVFNGLNSYKAFLRHSELHRHLFSF